MQLLTSNQKELRLTLSRISNCLTLILHSSAVDNVGNHHSFADRDFKKEVIILDSVLNLTDKYNISLQLLSSEIATSVFPFLFLTRF